MRNILKTASLAIVAVATVGALSGTMMASADSNSPTNFSATMKQLNGSGASGTINVKLSGTQATVTESMKGLLAGSPHAQHFHFDADATHTCPTTSADANHDGIISSVEARSSYGTPVVSLTTSGDTSAAAALALTDFPTAKDGTISYTRTITLTADQVMDLQNGQLVAVVHGIDKNHNGKYDTDAGTSPLAKAALGNDNFPLEGTAPAACGVLTASSNNSNNNSGSTSDNSDSNAKMVADWALAVGAIGVVLAVISLAVASKRN